MAVGFDCPSHTVYTACSHLQGDLGLCLLKLAGYEEAHGTSLAQFTGTVRQQHQVGKGESLVGEHTGFQRCLAAASRHAAVGGMGPGRGQRIGDRLVEGAREGTLWGAALLCGAAFL